MCGIAGIFNLKKNILDENTPEILHSMIRQVSHRGPDERGFYSKGAIAFGHARLSIIDLFKGCQPICNEDRTVWIIVNGEIFKARLLGGIKDEQVIPICDDNRLIAFPNDTNR